MAAIISRNEAGLPSVPGSLGQRTLASWKGIRVHHTGGGFSSWKAIHDWQTVGRPPAKRLAYIGYSFGIAAGKVTELRGWERTPAHDHINTTIGVVFGGKYDTVLPPPADLDALVWFIGEANRRCGRTLPVSTHREAWPSGHENSTDCPGNKLHTWVKTMLPGQLSGPTEEDDTYATPPIDLPGNPNGHRSYAIPPVNSGSVPWGPAWLSVWADLFGGKAAFRLAVGDGNTFTVVKEKVVLESGKLFSMALPTGTRGLSFLRLPAGDGDTCTSSVSFSVEYARRR